MNDVRDLFETDTDADQVEGGARAKLLLGRLLGLCRARGVHLEKLSSVSVST